MSVHQIMCTFTNAVFGAKVCWMRDDDGRKVSILAILPKPTHLVVAGERSKRLAERAERLAVEEAARVGPVISKGVFLGGIGTGELTATGIAEMPCTPEIERRLVMSGIPQLR